MTPKLDGVAINGREDWQHAISPGLQPRAEEGFPGVSGRFVRQGAPQPDDLVLTGSLNGEGETLEAAMYDLNQNHLALLRYRNDGQLHAVAVDAGTFTDAELLAVEQVGPNQPASHGITAGKVGVRRPVRVAFRFHSTDNFIPTPESP